MSKTSITPQVVRHIANLAKLELNDAEVTKYQQDFERVLDYFKEIQQLDVSHIPETTAVTEEKNILREDIVQPSLPLSAALANAAQVHESCFVVPYVLEQKDSGEKSPV